MKITRSQLRQFIKEALEIHAVPEDISEMDPEETYGLGYYKGKEEGSSCETVDEGLINIGDTGSLEREKSRSSFEDAQADAMESGKAYFIKKNGEVVEFDERGNANVRTDMTNADAVDAGDGTVHYIGDI